MIVDTPVRTESSGDNGDRWRVAGAVLAAAVLVTSTVGLWLWLRQPSIQRTEQLSLAWSQSMTRLEVDISAGNLTITAGDSGTVTADRHLRWLSGRPVVTEEWIGSTLRITARCPGDADGCTAGYRLRVPAGVSVRATVDAGDVTVGGVDGAVELINKAGDIRLDAVAGRVRVRSDSGAVTGRELRSADVDVSIVAGDVDLAFSAAPARVTGRSTAGDVRIAVPPGGTGADGYTVTAETSAGKRDVTVREDSAGRHALIAHTEAGDVRVSYA